MRVRLHEAREVASGASGRNGGFALRGGAMPYDQARLQLGRDAASGLWRLTERYLERLAELAGDAFRAGGSLRLAADAAERDELHAEYEALREDGFDAEWLDELPPALA
jgi:gamma-glutamylputrescine oxidase